MISFSLIATLCSNFPHFFDSTMIYFPLFCVQNKANTTRTVPRTRSSSAWRHLQSETRWNQYPLVIVLPWPDSALLCHCPLCLGCSGCWSPWFAVQVLEPIECSTCARLPPSGEAAAVLEKKNQQYLAHFFLWYLLLGRKKFIFLQAWCLLQCHAVRTVNNRTYVWNHKLCSLNGAVSHSQIILFFTFYFD